MIGHDRCDGLSDLPATEQPSPAQVSIGLQSPLTQHAYPLRASPPASAPVIPTSYGLPFDTHKTQSAAAELCKRDCPAIKQSDQRERSLVGDAPSHRSLSPARRPSPALGSLPPLVHRDSTLSSTTEELITPLIPYQAHTLPPLNPEKADLSLPIHLPSIGASLIFSSYNTQILEASPMEIVQQRSAPPTIRITPIDALLQASELARDADLKYEAVKRGGGSV